MLITFWAQCSFPQATLTNSIPTEVSDAKVHNIPMKQPLNAIKYIYEGASYRFKTEVQRNRRGAML